MTTQPRFFIPNPCSQPWEAMTPTTDGRHCAMCATEVVDFTRMSEAEILAFLARPTSKSICGNMHAAQLRPAVAGSPVGRWSRWLVAGLALLGLRPLASQAAAPPVPLTGSELIGTHKNLAFNDVLPSKSSVTLQGRVLDDSTGLAVAGAWIFVDGTKYGAVTDEQGRFSLVLPASWKSVQKGKVSLKVQASPFEFKPSLVSVAVKAHRQPAPLVVRLLSVPGRGQIMGKIRQMEPPVAPPKS